MSRTGKEIVREMNRTGILVDLSACRQSHDQGRDHPLRQAGGGHPRQPRQPVPAQAQQDRRRAEGAGREAAACWAALPTATSPATTTAARSRNWCEMVAQERRHHAASTMSASAPTAATTSPSRDYDWMRMGRWTRGIDYGAASAARPGKAPPPAWFQEVHHLGLLPGGLKRGRLQRRGGRQDHQRQLAQALSRRVRCRRPGQGGAAGVRADRSGSRHHATRGRLMSAAP